MNFQIQNKNKKEVGLVREAIESRIRYDEGTRQIMKSVAKGTSTIFVIGVLVLLFLLFRFSFGV